MTTISAISSEILDNICSFLQFKDDVSDFRLVSRKFNDVGARHAFRKLDVYLFIRDFAMLRTLVNHPVYHKYVRSLEYVVDMLPLHHLNMELYTSKIFPERDSDLFRLLYAVAVRADSVALREFDDRVIERKNEMAVTSYRLYEVMFAWQALTLKNGHDFEELRELLPKFANLQDVTLAGDDEYREDYCGYQLAGRRSGSFGSQLEPLFQDDDKDIGRCPDQYQWRHADALLQALKGCSGTLKSLRVGRLNFTFLLQLESLNLCHSPQICGNLTRFEFTINVALLEGVEEFSKPTDHHVLRSRAECDRITSAGAVRALLKAMPNLTDLRLEFYTCKAEIEDPENFYVSFGDIIEPAFTWEKLRNVKLGHVKASRQQFVDFVKLHTATLDVLVMIELELLESSWLVFLPQLRHAIDETGTRVLLSGDAIGKDEEDGQVEKWYLGDPDTFYPDDDDREPLADDVADYLVGRLDQCPLTKENMREG